MPKVYYECEGGNLKVIKDGITIYSGKFSGIYNNPIIKTWMHMAVGLYPGWKG